MLSATVKELQAAHTLADVFRICKQHVHECPVKTLEPFEGEVPDAATAGRVTLPQLDHIKRMVDCSA